MCILDFRKIDFNKLRPTNNIIPWQEKLMTKGAQDGVDFLKRRHKNIIEIN